MSDTADPSTGTGAARKRGIEDVMGPAVVGEEEEDGGQAVGGGGKNSKKRLTEAEREERVKEKEAKEKEKAVKKAERDEKKRVKDEEKRKRDDEKAKKEKTQTRLGAFFVKKPFSPHKPPPEAQGPPDQPAVAAAPRTDYDRYFKPFFVKLNVTVAPPTPFPHDEQYKCLVKRSLDAALGLSSGSAPAPPPPPPPPPCEGFTGKRVADLLHIPPYKLGRRGKSQQMHTTKELLAQINASEKGASGKGDPTGEPLKLLNSLPTKFLRFAEDVRPPYSGTFTRKPTARGLLMGRNPFLKALPRVDYDYDSEAEWEDGAQGEDIEELVSDDGEEEEEGESVDEEMDGFLDDEMEDGVGTGKGRRVVGALVPVCSGLCWEDGSGRNRKFEDMRIGVLLEGVSAPIDPFSTAYWTPPPRPPPPPSLLQLYPQATTAPTPSPMDPPPHPPPPPSLFQRQPQTTTILTTNLNIPTPSPMNPPSSSTKPPRLVPPDSLPAFKAAVSGSVLTKTGLVEVLKKQFPEIAKEVIKNTLAVIARREGERERDKRWVLI